MSNRDGISARIMLVAGGNPPYHQVCFAEGYASSSAAPAHFGVGPKKVAELVEIRGPLRDRATFKDASADRVVWAKAPPR